jgi:hypothetical protein
MSPPKNPNLNPRSLIEIEEKLTYILESFTTFEHCMAPTSPLGAKNLKISQYTRDVNVEVMVKRLLLSFLTYARTQALSSCLASPSFIFSFKKSYSYMIKLPLVIQEMNNKNKCINTSP